MNISMLCFDNITNRLFDVSKLVSDIKVETSIFDNPGKLTFKVLRDANYTFKEGSTFAVTIDGFKLFKGYVFSRKDTDLQDSIDVLCYDALRYFKNKDSRAYAGMPSFLIARDACDAMVLPYRNVSGSIFMTAPIIHDNKSYFEMIKRALDETLINTGQWYIVRDNFGVIEHINVLDLRAPFLIGDAQGLIKYSYEVSIDSDTYNQIKLYRDNDDTKKRDVFIVNDTAVNGGENIRRWGVLQLYESVDEKFNAAQIEERAFGKLRLYNAPKKTLKLSEVIGFLPMAAGYVFPVRIANTMDGAINQWMLCTSCTHSFKQGSHTMSITAEVVNGEWS